jgi:hypothetical protein
MMFGSNGILPGDLPPPQMGPDIQLPQHPAHKKKGGMFGSGVGAGEIIQALLSGALAARGNPAGQMGLQMLQQKRQQALEEAQYQRRRGEGLEDYAQKQKIEQQYGRAAQPHYFEDNSGNQWAIGPDGQPRMVHKDELPFKLVPNGLGGVVPVDLRTLMQQRPQQEEILDALPPGAKPIGGPSLGGSGGFPGPF